MGKPYPIPDQNGQSIPIFRPKQRKKPTQWGGTYLYGLYKAVPPPLPGTVSHFNIVRSFKTEDKTSFTFTLANCCNVTVKGNKAPGKN